MSLTGPQCLAARALVEWPLEQVAEVSGVDAVDIARFETRQSDLTAAAKLRVREALESGGAVFIPENGGGLGVRLKYARRDVRGINKLESEGGRAGEDDV